MLVCPKESEDVVGDDSSTSKVPLASVSHVVIDEVHERDTNTDFCLTLLRALLRRNQHLRVILMSATASASLFVQYFAEQLDKDPSVITIPGRSFPVDVRWLAGCEKFASSQVQNFNEKIDPPPKPSNNGSSSMVALSPRATDKIDNKFIKDLIISIVRDQQTQGLLTPGGGERENGAILIFLPGRGEIEALSKILYEDPTVGKKDVCVILKLHSAVPRGAQQVVFKRAKEGTVKVVLVTNIAETSITIPVTRQKCHHGRSGVETTCSSLCHYVDETIVLTRQESKGDFIGSV
jgi:HrpA-like RNA helicase